MNLFLQQFGNGLITGSGFVLSALGVNLLFGVLRVVNFAHGIIYMLGGYFVYSCMILFTDSYILALVATIVVIGLCTALLYPVLFRRLRGLPLASSMILTFGLAMVLEEAVRMYWGPAPLSIQSPFTDATVRIGDISFNGQLVFAAASAVLLVAILAFVLNKTPIGLKIRAVAEDVSMAEILGVNVDRIAGLTWGIGGALTAAAGALILPAYSVETQAAFSVAIMAFVVVIVGGLGSVKGTVLAGLLIGVATSLAEGYITSGMTELIAFGTLLLVLVFKPTGFAGRAV